MTLLSELCSIKSDQHLIEIRFMLVSLGTHLLPIISLWSPSLLAFRNLGRRESQNGNPKANQFHRKLSLNKGNVKPKNETRKLSIFEKLPSELIVQIAGLLPHSSAALLTSTCRTAYVALGNSSWTSLYDYDEREQHSISCCSFQITSHQSAFSASHVESSTRAHYVTPTI